MKNIYCDNRDTSTMAEEEFVEYGLSRMRVMLKLEQDAVGWLKAKDTPFQQKVLELARHHVEICEERFGISRYDIRLS